jgi:ABC-2 type transport system permease protein
VLANLLSTGTVILLLWAMFQRVESVGGWSFDQVLVLIGIVTTIDYVVEIWLYPSLSKITTYVQKGEFDALLVKPVPSQFLVTFRYLQVLDVFGLATGLAIIGIGMHRTGTIEPLNLLLLALFLVAAVAIIYSLYLALSTLAFWFTRIEEVASVIWLHSTVGSFPVAAYPPWARLIFTFVLPVAFVTNVPAEAATGRLSWEWGLGALAFSAFALATISSLCWWSAFPCRRNVVRQPLVVAMSRGAPPRAALHCQRALICRRKIALLAPLRTSHFRRVRSWPTSTAPAVRRRLPSISLTTPASRISAPSGPAAFRPIRPSSIPWRSAGSTRSPAT